MTAGSAWLLEKVFWVMGGYMVATGILAIHLALSGVRSGSTSAWIVAATAGLASVGLMAVVNLKLRQTSARPCRVSASLWTAAVVLAAFGV